MSRTTIEHRIAWVKRQEEYCRTRREFWQKRITKHCQERQRLEAELSGQTTVEEQLLAAAAELDERVPDPDECDRCFSKRELYHDEESGLAVCDRCLS